MYLLVNYIQFGSQNCLPHRSDHFIKNDFKYYLNNSSFKKAENLITAGFLNKCFKETSCLAHIKPSPETPAIFSPCMKHQLVLHK